MTKDFFEQQRKLTTAKIEIYEKYLKKYLPKILMGFKKCFIADLFCGAGKNGEEKGSPLVLLDTVKYLLTSETLQKENPQIYILFNDGEKQNIENLEKELEGFLHPSVNIIPRQNKPFEELLPSLIESIKNSAISNIPKFFFLDPFTYSNVKISHLQDILNLEHTEILLFFPIFHLYRFANDQSLSPDHATRVCLEEFTMRGVTKYKDINDFMKSIKEKLKQKLSLGFVRPVLLDDGKCKNALFLLTKNINGMLAMNKVALGESEDGKGINIKNNKQKSLFGTQGESTFEIFTEKLTKKLKERGEMTNEDIVFFTIAEEFLPKHAKDILGKLYEEDKIKVFDQFGKEIEKKNQWSIAEPKSLKKTTIFRFNK